MTMHARLTRIETERSHRRRRWVAAAVAGLEGVPFETAFARTFVAPADKAAVLGRFGRVGRVDVADLVRFLAERSGLTAQETSEAITQALRVAALLEARDGEDR